MQGPRLYRFFNYEQVDYLPAPIGGWAPDINPWELAPTQAQALDNFIIRPDRIFMRGPLIMNVQCNDTNFAIAPVALVLGDVTNSGSTHWGLMVNKMPDATAKIDHWNVPLLRPNASTALAKANLSHTTSPTYRWVSLNSNPSTSAPSVDLTSAPGPRYINFNGLIYGITYDAQGNANATATDANNNYTIWKTCLYTLPLTQNGFTQPTLQTAAPQGAFDLKGYQARIWMLGGVDTPGGLTAHEPVTLYFSRPLGDTQAPALGSPLGNLATDWKDPVSGLTNKLTMDANTSDYGVGLAVIRNAMIIFRRNSVWILRGSTTQNYTLQLLSNQVGCIDARTIVEVDGGVYWLGQNGLMFTQGTVVVDVESPAQVTLRKTIEYQQGSIRPAGGGNGGWASSALLSDGSILITLGVQTVSGGVNFSTDPLWSAIFTPTATAKGVWTQITSLNFKNGNSFSAPNQLAGPIFSRRSDYLTYTVDDQNIYAVEDLSQFGMSILHPEVMTLNAFGGMYDVTPGPPWVANYIPALWQTKYVDVITASRRRSGITKRHFLDYGMSLVGTPDSNAFTVEMVNADDVVKNTKTYTALLAENANRFRSTFPSAYSPAFDRGHTDAALEIDDMYFNVKWVGSTNVGASSGAHGVGFVHGIGVEWQGTSELHDRT